MLKTGTTFEKIVDAEGKTPADTLLGTFAKDKIPDPAIADAAFALQANEVSEVFSGMFGPVLIRVTEIQPEVVKPLAEVTEQIRKELALGEASRILLDVHDSMKMSGPPADAAPGGGEAEAGGDLERSTAPARTPDGSIVTDLPESGTDQRRSTAEVSQENALCRPPAAVSSSSRSKASRRHASGRWRKS